MRIVTQFRTLGPLLQKIWYQEVVLDYFSRYKMLGLWNWAKRNLGRTSPGEGQPKLETGQRVYLNKSDDYKWYTAADNEIDINPVCWRSKLS